MRAVKVLAYTKLAVVIAIRLNNNNSHGRRMFYSI